MSYIGQAPGLGQRVPFRFVATAGQTTFSGNDANGYPLGYTPGLVDIYLNGRLLSEPDVTASDGSTIILAAGLSAGDELRVLAQAPFSPANTYTMAQADSFQRRRNRITDPGMRVSQEQGNNSLAVGAATVYPSDSFSAFRSTTTGGFSVQRVALATPGGSPYRIRATVTSPIASPAADDQCWFNTRIEGIDTADLKFGTASARTITLRFGCRVSVAGTYAISLINGALNRTWLGTITIAPGEVGIDVVKFVTITGDQAGSWNTDTSVGFTIYVTLCTGSNRQGVAGWQNGGLLGLASSTNLMATNGATFDLFDVGLYDVTGLQSGVIPPFELSDYAADEAKCFRYFEYLSVTYQVPGAASLISPLLWRQRMRIAPSVSVAVRASSNCSYTVNYYDSDGLGISASATAANGFVGLYVTANARL